MKLNCQSPLTPNIANIAERTKQCLNSYLFAQNSAQSGHVAIEVVRTHCIDFTVSELLTDSPTFSSTLEFLFTSGRLFSYQKSK